MTQQSIGGRNAQDGISGTPSGTQGADSGQGINQGGQNQQSSQGHTDHSVASPGNRGGMQGGITNSGSVQLDPQESNRDRYGDQETGATSGEVGDGRSRQQVAVSGSQATQHSKGRDDGALPKGGRNPQSVDSTDGTGEGGLTQATPVQQQQSKPRAGTGGGHGGQHSGGMGGESGGALHNVGAQSGQTGRGGLGGNNAGMQGGSEGNQQSGDNPGNSMGDSGLADDDLDTLQAGATGGERAGMGKRGNSQQSDKAGNAQGGMRQNQTVPNNRSDNEQADRQLGMQGSQGDPGHDIDDLGNKQSGGGGSRGGTEDQR